MPKNYGPQCQGCGGEDCCCCEVWLEAQADARAALDEPDPIDPDDFPDRDDEDDEDQPDEPGDGLTDVEADAQTLAGAGYGTDEDYQPDTPLGDLMGGE